jgi:nucleotide-binding universal stress UspA family protein
VIKEHEDVQTNSDSLTASSTNHNLELTCSVVSDKDVAHAIINVAEQAKEETSASSSVIAITTYGHGGQARWATGSVAGRVLHATQLPLLIVRPTRLEKQRD